MYLVKRIGSDFAFVIDLLHLDTRFFDVEWRYLRARQNKGKKLYFGFNGMRFILYIRISYQFV